MNLPGQHPSDFSSVVLAFGSVLQKGLGLPFDLARAHYAKVVQLGLVEQSMLQGAKFEQALHAMEKLSLGPWARRV